MTWPDRLGLLRIGAYVLVALLVVGVVLPRLDALLPSAQHDALVIRNTQAWIKGDHARAAGFARLQARSDSLTAAARAARVQGARDRAATLALAGALTLAKTAADSVPILVKLVVQKDVELADARQENAKLWQAHRTDSTTIAGVNAALAEAMTNLRATVQVADCRWLLFKCPSRTTVAEVSLGLGVVATLLLAH